MKKFVLFFPAIVFTLFSARGQGSLALQYDQISTVNTTLAEGGPNSIFSLQPVGQSFTPTLSLVGFAQFYLYDSSPGLGTPAIIDILLRSDSISGPILGTTSPISVGGKEGGSEIFLFPTPVSVVSGATYFFQINLISGDHGVAAEFPIPYSGGDGIEQGVSFGHDLWFGEGIVVPEPSVWGLMTVGGGLIVCLRKRRK